MIHKITVNGVYQIKDMVNQLAFFNGLHSGEKADIDIDLQSSYIAPEYMAMIVSAINNAKIKGIKVNILKFEASSDYPARINFCNLLKIPYEETHSRKSSNGRFVEIIQMDVNGNDKNDIDLVNRIMKVIKNNFKVEDSIYITLNFCLWEIIDNIKLHSGSKAKYTLVVQNFPKANHLDICVIDNGAGLYKSLTQTSTSQFKDLTAKSAVQMCTEKDVTDGKGCGYGLYSYKNFAINNKGMLIIYSGNYFQEIKGGSSTVKRGQYWDGTIIFNRIKTDVPVDINEIFDNQIPTSVDECDSEIEGLW